ncbi:MAG: sigma 54-interacting transcriptional regulator [Planctomycetota bacterium]|nr:sigma 54-interacting transcriptional regulator [Planctomycetota bacterium]
MVRSDVVLVTWHSLTEGVEVLRTVSAYLGRIRNLNDKKWSSPIILDPYDEQNSPPRNKCGIQISKLYYLLPSQKCIDRIHNNPSNDAFKESLKKHFASRRWADELDAVWKDVDPDSNVSHWRSLENLQELYDAKNWDISKSHYMKIFAKFLPLVDQFKWLKMSNGDDAIFRWEGLEVIRPEDAGLEDESKFDEDLQSEKIEVRRLHGGGKSLSKGVFDLYNEGSVALWLRQVVDEISTKEKGNGIVISSAPGVRETFLSWYLLAEANLLDDRYTIIKSGYDKTHKPGETWISFKVSEKKLLTALSNEPLYTESKSDARKRANYLWQHYGTQRQSVLRVILGERGVGKSKLIRDLKSDNRKVVTRNCASFQDDTTSESELFGHVKGAFTDATKDKVGAFEEARGQILFLDEVHHLSLRVQAKLLLAIQTDDEGNFSIRPFGGNEPKKMRCKLVFASNRPIKELINSLSRDFFDRISQQVIYLPPLRECLDDLQSDFVIVWKRLKLSSDCPIGKENEPQLLPWLREYVTENHGNFRDLQKVAITCHNYSELKAEKSEVCSTSLMSFLREQLAYTSLAAEEQEFSTGKTAKQIVVRYKQRLAEWAIMRFGSASAAAEHFRNLGDKIAMETLYRWKNRK